jgi:hypothetical protein
VPPRLARATDRFLTQPYRGRPRNHLFHACRTQNGGQQSNTISLPCVGNATAAVDSEGRSIPLTGGRLTDSFADGNAIDIYSIDGGSTCGAG